MSNTFDAWLLGDVGKLLAGRLSESWTFDEGLPSDLIASPRLIMLWNGINEIALQQDKSKTYFRLSSLPCFKGAITRSGAVEALRGCIFDFW
jgi:hypothetical protein